MRTSQIILIFSLFLFLFNSACKTTHQDNQQAIALATDYDQYLNEALLTQDLNLLEKQMQFWQAKLQKDPQSITSLSKIASLYARRFKITGDIEDIHRSDKIWQNLQAQYPEPKTGPYFALAQNSITQHQFKRAFAYLQKAQAIGDEKFTTHMMLVDAAMELGKHELAQNLLAQTANKNSFDYLIRYAKTKDHEGDLDSAIICMEKAFARLEKGQNKELYCWALSNLGDMYGHAGRIRESYEAYLKVLEKQPDYDYALKGIAWIAYAHDQKPEEAKRIIHFLRKKKDSPDYLLFLAEIADYQGDEKAKKAHLKAFYEEVSKPSYGPMYYKYLIELALEEYDDPDQAIRLAQQEVQNRPCVQSYDLLAWSYFKQGSLDKAYQIAREQVEEKSYEPDVLYHLGVILKAKGEEDKARKYLEEAAESSFELGPITTREIIEKMKS